MVTTPQTLTNTIDANGTPTVVTATLAPIWQSLKVITTVAVGLSLFGYVASQAYFLMTPRDLGVTSVAFSNAAAAPKDFAFGQRFDQQMAQATCHAPGQSRLTAVVSIDGHGGSPFVSSREQVHLQLQAADGGLDVATAGTMAYDRRTSILTGRLLATQPSRSRSQSRCRDTH